MQQFKSKIKHHCFSVNGLNPGVSVVSLYCPGLVKVFKRRAVVGTFD